MAATRLIPMHLQQSRSMGQCLKERTDYAKNVEKTEDGEYVSSYECDPDTVDLEFAITKNQYAVNTGTEKFDSLSTRQKEIEARLAEIKTFRQHIFNYSKTKKIYVEYKARKFDAGFFEEHREALTLHQAARDAFKKFDGPIPTIRELDAEFQKLVREKNQNYAEFKIARAEMRELLAAKQNVEQFLGEQNHPEKDVQKNKGDTVL